MEEKNIKGVVGDGLRAGPLLFYTEVISYMRKMETSESYDKKI